MTFLPAHLSSKKELRNLPVAILIEEKNWGKIKRRRERVLNLEVSTKLSEEKVIQRLKKFFGEGGLGLDVIEEAPRCVSFRGGGGHVTATLCSEEARIRITLVTQEWENQVKKFASSLP
jgi:ribosomal protein RSM22 (predicted rRNA methylase)